MFKSKVYKKDNEFISIVEAILLRQQIITDKFQISTEQMKKTVIANKGQANTGKSTTIQSVAQKILGAYPGTSVPPKIDFSKDIKFILDIGTVKIGVESQGDPNSRLPASLKEFALAGCDLILCATRTSGETVRVVSEMNTVHDYDVVWVANYRSRQKNVKDLNDLSAEHIFELVQQVISGTI